MVISAISGMGGVGKTELALQYSLYHWEKNDYPGGVCWLDARLGELGTEIVNLARSQSDLYPREGFDLKTQLQYC